MRVVALMVALFAGVTPARRVQPTHGVQDNRQSQNSHKSLATLLLALNPKSAFNPSTLGAPMSMGHTALRSAVPSMAAVGVIGGTGGVGMQICKAALEAGHDVKILARSPDKVPGKFGEEIAAKLAVVPGDSTSADAVSELAKDQEVILCVVGMPAKQTPENCIMAKTAEAILSGTKAGQRVVFCSSLGMGGSSKFIRFLLKLFAGKPNVDDYDKADQLLTDAIGKGGATITVVRPTSLDDSEALGYYDATEKRGFALQAMSRTDVSKFFVDSITEKTWDDKAVQLLKGKK